MAVVRADPDDLYRWDRIEETTIEWMNGPVAVTTITYDDGSTLERGYRDGALLFADRWDGDGRDGTDLLDWDRISIGYGTDGVIDERTIYFESGLVRWEEYSNGELHEVWTGVEDPKQSLAYDSVGYVFYGPGTWDREIYPKEGGFRIDEWVGGLRKYTFEWGSRFSPSKYEYAFSGYGYDGVLDLRYVEQNDGTEKSIHFNDGRKVSVALEDAGDAYDWNSILTLHGPDGSVVSRTILYDDGRERTESFSEGVRAQVHVVDQADVHDWSETFFFYSDGAATARMTVDDMGETVIKHLGDEKAAISAQALPTRPVEAFLSEEVLAYSGTDFEQIE